MQLKRDETFRLVMLPVEKTALASLAEHDGGSQAAIVRRLIRSEAEKRGLWPIAQVQPSQVRQEVRP